MDNKKLNLRKGCSIAIAVYVIFALLFLFVGDYQIKYTRDEAVSMAAEATTNLGALKDGDVVTQQILSGHQFLSGVDAYFATYGQENKGSVTIKVTDQETGKVLFEKEEALKTFQDNSWHTFETEGLLDVSETIGHELVASFTFKLEEGDSVTMGCGNDLADTRIVTLNGQEMSGNLCVTLQQTNKSSHAAVYPIGLAILLVILIAVSIWIIEADKKDKKNFILDFLYLIKRYKFLMDQLVSRDFKTKYKRSVLGVFWSFLNPLLTMAVQYVVFSRLFRFNVPNYPMYLLTGIIFFNGFNDASTQAMNAIVGNASLITKVYVPKYIYPISKVLSSSINILFSLIPLFLVGLITGVRPSMALLMIPFGIICYLLFIIGLSFILSAAMTFFRDMQFLWGVFTMMWMYATPVIYPIETIQGTFLYPLQKINPLYHFITFFRTTIIYGVSPEPSEYLLCIAFAATALLVGGLVFRKTQDKFILYI